MTVETEGKTFRFPRMTHEANFVLVTLQIFTHWINEIPHAIVLFFNAELENKLGS